VCPARHLVGELQRQLVDADIDRVVSVVRVLAKDLLTLGWRRAARCAVLVLAVLVSLGAVPQANGARTLVGRARSRGGAHIAVVGGQSAEPGTFPWMAYVLDVHGDYAGQCSGTVVAPDLVLTAGHCAENMQTGVLNEASGYQVVTGNVDWNAAETERQVSGVTKVIACSCFDRGTDIGDVALLELSTPTTAPAVTLASSPRAGTKALLAGWGRTYYNQETLDERLQWAPTVVRRPQHCEQEAPPFSPASEICVVDTPSRQTGSCEGDSGGPLLVAEPSAVGGMVQIGVDDHGYGECATSSPSVFARVDAISAWVRGWAQALASAPPASASLPGDTVAMPMLPGVASTSSLTLGGNGVSLVLTCDNEGGICSGHVDATIRVREKLILRRGDSRTVLHASTRTVRLTSVGFVIVPGYSTAVRAVLSPQNLALLSRLGRVPLEVLLSGPGFSSRVVRMEPDRAADDRRRRAIHRP
jgi:secreted trypsin-like serine protease